MKGAELSPNDKQLFENELNKLIQDGYGIANGSIKGAGLGKLDFLNLGEKLFSKNPLQFKELLDSSLDKLIIGRGLKESMARGIKRIIYGALPFLQWFDSDKTILQGRGLKQF